MACSRSDTKRMGIIKTFIRDSILNDILIVIFVNENDKGHSSLSLSTIVEIYVNVASKVLHKFSHCK